VRVFVFVEGMVLLINDRRPKRMAARKGDETRLIHGEMQSHLDAGIIDLRRSPQDGMRMPV
jgi:hypothetical protein